MRNNETYMIALLLGQLDTLVERLAVDELGGEHLAVRDLIEDARHAEHRVACQQLAELAIAGRLAHIVALVRQLALHHLHNILHIHALGQQLRHVHHRHQIVNVALYATRHARILNLDGHLFSALCQLAVVHLADAGRGERLLLEHAESAHVVLAEALLQHLLLATPTTQHSIFYPTRKHCHN